MLCSKLDCQKSFKLKHISDKILAWAIWQSVPGHFFVASQTGICQSASQSGTCLKMADGSLRGDGDRSAKPCALPHRVPRQPLT